MIASSTTVAVNSWRVVGSPQWIDGTRGRNLRSLFVPSIDEEIVAADLSVITERLWGMMKSQKDGLRWALSEQQLFHVLIDHVVARMKSHRGLIIGPRQKAVTPAGWSSEDENVWQEWLTEEVLSPERLDHLVFGEELRCWELRLGGDWRQEVIAYLPYLVCRSWEILREIDPRPINPEIESYGHEEEGGRRR